MNVRLNLRFSFWLAVALGALGLTVHCAHAYQAKRNVGTFLVQADLAEKEAETADGRAKVAHYQQAVEYLRRYLISQPQDTDVRARLGGVLEGLADLTGSREAKAQALLVYDEVLNQASDRSDIRRKAVNLAMAPGIARYQDALDHLDILIKSNDHDSDLYSLDAQCQEATGKYAEARAQYTKATEAPRAQPDTYLRYAVLLRSQFNEPAKADEVMTKMVQANPTARAYLFLCDYWRKYETQSPSEHAVQALAEAQKLDPDHVDVLLQSANMALGEKESSKEAVEKGRTFLRRAIDLHPTDPRPYQLLAGVEARTNRKTEAIAVLQRGMEAVPENVRIGLLWDLADLLVADNARSEFADVVKRLAEAGTAEPLLDYLAARRLFAQEEWRLSANALERVRIDLEVRPDLVKHADLLLGLCYEKLGDVDRQYGAYRRLVKADPLSLAGCLGLGAALESLGKTDEALKTYEVALRDERVPEVRLRVVRLLSQRNQGLPKSEQRWDVVDRLLEDASKAPDQAAEVAIHRAEALLVRGQPEQAEEVLAAAQKQQPREVKLWVALASLAEATGKSEAALARLNEAERTLGDSADLRMAMGAYWLRRDEAKARPALARLADGVETLPLDERKRLLRGLAVAAARTGDTAGAAQHWSRVAELEPKDLGARIALFDLAMQAKDPQAVTRAVDEIRRIEGSEGSLWKYARASQLIELAQKGDRAGLTEARELLENAATARPNWSRVHLCAAMLEELDGHRDLALTKYQEAIELGERGPETIRQAVRLLYERRRFADADAVLKKLPRQAAIPDDLLRMAAEVSLRTQPSPGHALELARKAVHADSKDFRDHLWLGQMLSQSETDYDEAEKALQRALTLADTEQETWVALVQLLARKGKKDEAKALIVRAKAKLPEKASYVAFARCYEAVGQIELAKEQYAVALAAKPDDVDLLSDAAKFSLRVNELDKAKSYLTRISGQTERPDDAAWARRMLPFVQYAGGGYQGRREALAMMGILDGQISDDTVKQLSPDDLRSRAVLLATQWESSQRREAIRLFETLETRQPLTADDQFMLGRIYESVGKWPEASKRMSTVLAANADNPTYLAIYADSLLRHKQAEAAAVWLRKLEAKNPMALATVQLKARLLKDQGSDSEAAATVKSYAATKDADLVAAARLLESINQLADAEALLKQYVAASKKPEAALVLAAFYGRHDRTAEALDVCERAAPECRPDAVAFTCVEALYQAQDPKPHLERMERWLEQAVKKDARRSDFAPILAALRNLQGRYGECATLYKQVLQKNPKDTLAMNNLAFLLAVKEDKCQEALDLLQRAQNEAGPGATLADTRAVVYLKVGDKERALQELGEVIVNAPTATAYFHLAQVHEAARDRNAARIAFHKARELKLEPKNLHLLERPAYERMADLLETK